MQGDSQSDHLLIRLSQHKCLLCLIFAAFPGGLLVLSPGCRNPSKVLILILIDMLFLDSNSNNGISSQSNSSQDSLEVRVGKNMMIPCTVLGEVIQQDGVFKATYWSYCASKSCTTIETKWLWLAGMNSDRKTKVTDSGRYSNRVNLTRNGTLEINSVQMADTTDYRCTVTRINYTSPLVYFVSLLVNTSGKSSKFSLH